MLTGNELRSRFLKYFEAHGHKVVASSSLVPLQDPTLMFTNAGMNQFKRVFTGEERRDYPRATTSQKCVRAGGKHNDLENVGHTARHHTFFEMLGNFSFGDYFKEDAIRFAWDFLIHDVKLDASRMRATVFKGEQGVPGDDEAFALWQKLAGLPPERIHRLGMKDNFWSMGDTGPCGPCSELHYHQGDHLPCAEEAAGRHCLGVECECDRWLEIWNLVFMQFNRKESGELEPLPKPSIDTGMGLERLAAVAQGKLANYETDLFTPIIDFAAGLAGVKGKRSAEQEVALRVVADHSRATTFLIGDGVLPSNEGRGYVLRRIMRRAMRYGRKLGLHEPFLFKVSGTVIDQMSGAYPELVENANYIARVVKAEEERFNETLDKGMGVFEDAVAKLAKTGGECIGGEVLFKLYDTYGFPVDLTRIMAEERNLRIDEAGFEAAMEEQRNRAREAWKGSGDEAVKGIVSKVLDEVGPTSFVGYETTDSEATVKKILVGEQMVDAAGPNSEIEFVLDATPFYGASGGQVGDKGHLEIPGGRVRILDTSKPLPHLVLHHGVVESGTLRVGQPAHLHVDVDLRNSTRRNHTATHLLQAALRTVLGDHVKQAGSLVSPDRLRFDFTHFSALEPRELQAVEDLVNREILANAKVETQVLPYDEAVKGGAMALFGEKYESEVRVVSVPGFSRELCGGTHVTRTGDIGFFLITSEGGVAAGVRRIEAVTGYQAILHVRERSAKLAEAAALVKSSPDELPARLSKAIETTKELEREIQRLKQKLAGGASTDLMAGVKTINGVPVLAAEVEARDPKEMRETYDQLKQRMPTGVLVLGARHDGKVFLLAAVTPDLTAKFKAGAIVKELAGLVGGSGGGKPELAQAGGTLPEKLPEALARVEALIG
jgi:alanyl-tRNA synthetase